VDLTETRVVLIFISGVEFVPVAGVLFLMGEGTFGAAGGGLGMGRVADEGGVLG